MSDKIKVAWIPGIEEWHDVYECDHGLYWRIDPGDGLRTYIKDGDGVVVIETTEDEFDDVAAAFESKLRTRSELTRQGE